MRKCLTLFFNISLLVIISLPTFSEQLVPLSPINTSIQFTARHLGKQLVHGHFNHVTGNVLMDGQNIRAIKAFIDVDSIDTANRLRNKYLTSKRFLNSKKYPSIRFVATEFIASNNQLIATGELMINGVTNTIELNIKKQNKTFTISHLINRFNYNLMNHKKMIGQQVSVNVTFTHQ